MHVQLNIKSAKLSVTFCQLDSQKCNNIIQILLKFLSGHQPQQTVWQLNLKSCHNILLIIHWVNCGFQSRTLQVTQVLKERQMFEQACTQMLKLYLILWKVDIKYAMQMLLFDPYTKFIYKCILKLYPNKPIVWMQHFFITSFRKLFIWEFKQMQKNNSF